MSMPRKEREKKIRQLEKLTSRLKDKSTSKRECKDLYWDGIGIADELRENAHRSGEAAKMCLYFAFAYRERGLPTIEMLAQGKR